MAENLSLPSLIRQRLSDRQSRFVFPSDVTADFWAEQAAMMAATGAVDRERFMAWDDFKALTLTAEKADWRPANQMIRCLFAAELLAENAAAAAQRQSLLHDIIWPEFADEAAAYISLVAEALVGLDAVLRQADQAPNQPTAAVETASDPLADWRLIHERYAKFLQQRQVFEPTWEPVSFQPKGFNWCLFFPELAADWLDYQAAIQASAEAQVYPLNCLSGPSAVLPAAAASLLGPCDGAYLRFTNTDDELAFVAERIQLLLSQGGLDQDDIVISAAQAASLDFDLETNLRLRGINIDTRRSQSLADYPVGRLFSALADCLDSRWSFKALKNLLLDPAFNWKPNLPRQALIDFGLDYHCIAGFQEGSRTVDVWLASFSGLSGAAALKQAAVKQFYLDLKRSVSGLLSASSFRLLLEKILQFERDFFDKATMDEGFDRLFSRVIEELRRLAETAEELGVNLAARSAAVKPYNFFIQHLASVRYVFQSQQPGVKFYDYRVAAGIAPVVHFILNVNQAAATVRVEPLAFLREDQRPAGRVPQRDLSADFIKAYRLSGGAVIFTMADRTFDGPALASAGLPQPIPGPVTALDGGPAASPPDEIGGFPPATGLDLRVSRLKEPELLERLQAGLSVGGKIRLSPTSLKVFADCPFAWLVRQALGLEETAGDIIPIDQRELGLVFHRILGRCFNQIKQSSGCFLKVKLADYRSLVDQTSRQVLTAMAAQAGAFQAAIYPMLERRVLEALYAYLEADAARLDGLTILGAELELEKTYDQLAICLAGRADLVGLTNDDGFVIIDFKTGNTPAVKDLVLDATGRLVDLQMAAYIRMLEAGTDRRTTEARFYSLDKRQTQLLLTVEADGKQRLPKRRLDYEPELEALDQVVADLAEALTSGYFPIAPAAERPRICPRCPVAKLCRIQYAGGGR